MPDIQSVKNIELDIDERVKNKTWRFTIRNLDTIIRILILEKSKANFANLRELARGKEERFSLETPVFSCYFYFR